jgi:hypothetical protein
MPQLSYNVALSTNVYEWKVARIRYKVFKLANLSSTAGLFEFRRKMFLLPMSLISPL